VADNAILEVDVDDNTRLVKDYRGGLHTAPKVGDDGELINISRVHHEVHESEMYSASARTADGSELADNATLVLALKTTTKTAHLTFDVVCGGDAEVHFYENSILSSDGVQIMATSMNRDVLGTPVTTCYVGSAYTASGTELYRTNIIGGTKNQAVGGAIRHDTEWILGKNRTYTIAVINRAGSGKATATAVQFYEE
jgi:hypothetical protein